MARAALMWETAEISARVAGVKNNVVFTIGYVRSAEEKGAMEMPVGACRK
jgi:hypothetical protein